MQLSSEITSRGVSFLVTVRGTVILVGVAQLVERVPSKHKVVGSKPTGRSSFMR